MENEFKAKNGIFWPAAGWKKYGNFKAFFKGEQNMKSMPGCAKLGEQNFEGRALGSKKG